ncbi:hypothetical protein [Pseudomonas sp. NPDC087817]|uniref:hypothetical protein n=1 Tax=Pseudomonas sp. NPDC087817 TaxID=3364451 RepID=UPI0038143FA4
MSLLESSHCVRQIWSAEKSIDFLAQSYGNNFVFAQGGVQIVGWPYSGVHFPENGRKLIQIRNARMKIN